MASSKERGKMKQAIKSSNYFVYNKKGCDKISTINAIDILEYKIINNYFIQKIRLKILDGSYRSAM